MARPKTVTIKLSPKQREQIRKLTGNDHVEVRFERVAGRTSKVAAKASLARKTPLSGKGSGSVFGGQGNSTGIPSGVDVNR